MVTRAPHPVSSDATTAARIHGPLRRLAWITDPHFDHATLDTWQIWVDGLLAEQPDALIVTGDLSEGDDVAFQLRRLAETLDRPVFFVLGNHDFYGKRIAEARRDIIQLARDLPRLVYLTDCGAVLLDQRTALVGDDGWGDAVEGDFECSSVRLNDFEAIDDFRGQAATARKAILQQQGRESADRLGEKLRSLPDSIDRVLVATHVPPFREACWYHGHTTDDHWAPFFVCGQVGQLLRHIAKEFPSRQFVVLCGHTHHDGIAQMADNLIVHTGFSDYGQLATESMLRLGEDSLRVPRQASTGKFSNCD